MMLLTLANCRVKLRAANRSTAPTVSCVQLPSADQSCQRMTRGNMLASPQVELDKARRRDRQLRDPDYDSHMGLMRDPVTREVVTTATHT
jgi:hypothetical protein